MKSFPQASVIHMLGVADRHLQTDHQYNSKEYKYVPG